MANGEWRIAGTKKVLFFRDMLSAICSSLLPSAISSSLLLYAIRHQLYALLSCYRPSVPISCHQLSALLSCYTPYAISYTLFSPTRYVSRVKGPLPR